MARCPVCGSEALFPDTRTGFIVCRSCGYVAEPIVAEWMPWVYPPERRRNPPSQRSVVEAVLWKERVLARKRRLGMVERRVRRYEELFKRLASRARPGVVVDTTALLTVMSGGRARLYRHRDEEAALRSLEQDPLAKKMYERVVAADPRLSSLTVRGRVAAAHILAALHRGEEPNIRVVAAKARISLKAAWRIKKRVLSRLRRFAGGRPRPRGSGNVPGAGEA